MKIENIIIRKTYEYDFNNIMEVESKAFGHDKEAKLTADLLTDNSAEPIISLMAFHDEKAVGHILYTRSYIDEINDNQPYIHILAPLAVIPEYQKQGIGGLLINEGIKILKELGSELLFVLGHMDYYPKFGFIPDAKNLGYTAPYPIPKKHANAWMVQSLTTNGFTISPGNVICANKLNKPEHWRE
jgi:putative acetyltransferase